MNAKTFFTWLNQRTTQVGLTAVIGGVSGYFSGAVTLPEAIPVVLMGLGGMAAIETPAAPSVVLVPPAAAAALSAAEALAK